MSDKLSVCVEGGRDGFNSKMAVDKFKLSVKNGNLNVEDLSKHYIKSNYELLLVEKTDSLVKFKIQMKQLSTREVLLQENENHNDNDKKELLKSKLKLMRENRTNHGLTKAKIDNTVPENILKEYIKLKKVSPVPVPEPHEILSKPEEYREILSMVLGNQMMKTLGNNHPYVKYFRLLAEKVGVTEVLPFPTQSHLQTNVVVPKTMQHLIKTSGEVSYKLGNNDDDTDSE